MKRFDIVWIGSTISEGTIREYCADGELVEYSDVAPLVEAAYRAGFRDGFAECAREDRGIEGDGEDAAWNTYVALTTIDAQERGE